MAARVEEYAVVDADANILHAPIVTPNKIVVGDIEALGGKIFNGII